jgi:hypothetical protein
MHNEQTGIVGWSATAFLMVVNMVTPQDWSYIMASITAGATAVFYIARTVEIIRKKSDDAQK